MNRYLAINIEGKIGQPTVIRTSSFIIYQYIACMVILDFFQQFSHNTMHNLYLLFKDKDMNKYYFLLSHKYHIWVPNCRNKYWDGNSVEKPEAK